MSNFQCSCGIKSDPESEFYPVNAVSLSEDEAKDIARRIFERYGCATKVLPAHDNELMFDALMLEECISILHFKSAGVDFDAMNQGWHAAHGYVIGSGLNLDRALDVIEVERRLHAGEYRLAYMPMVVLADVAMDQRRPGWWVLYDDENFLHSCLSYEDDGFGNLITTYLFKNPFV